MLVENSSSTKPPFSINPTCSKSISVVVLNFLRLELTKRYFSQCRDKMMLHFHLVALCGPRRGVYHRIALAPLLQILPCSYPAALNVAPRL
ncbi:MAG: hypothetical protein WBH01_00565 [Dehalococcoidia bacterium]